MTLLGSGIPSSNSNNVISEHRQPDGAKTRLQKNFVSTYVNPLAKKRESKRQKIQLQGGVGKPLNASVKKNGKNVDLAIAPPGH